MIKVLISKQGNFPVKSAIIKKKLAGFLASRGIVSDAEVSVAIVGEKKMLEIGEKYLGESSKPGRRNIHNVLSFTASEVGNDFRYPPDGKIYLGEIVVCFPVALQEASRENVLIDDKVYKLIEHGALHLLGIHHE